MEYDGEKDFIKIIIRGKCLKKKTFNIKLDANVEIVKRLILARIKKNNECVSTNVDKCILITQNNIKLDNNKKIVFYYKNKILFDNCELMLDIKMKNGCCSKSEYKFGSINNNITNQIMAAGFNIMNVESLVKSSVKSSKKGSKKREGWYDDLSWDDTPIDDGEWE